jgi:hypothetical protein
LKLSIELTQDEAQVLLVYLLCATLEKELAKLPRKDRPAPRR